MLEVHKCVDSVLREYVRYHSGVWIFVLDATGAICWDVLFYMFCNEYICTSVLFNKTQVETISRWEEMIQMHYL